MSEFPKGQRVVRTVNGRALPGTVVGVDRGDGWTHVRFDQGSAFSVRTDQLRAEDEVSVRPAPEDGVRALLQDALGAVEVPF